MGEVWIGEWQVKNQLFSNSLNFLLHDRGGARQVLSSRTKAQMSRREFFPQFSGLV
jgi:hypothetical protein